MPENTRDSFGGFANRWVGPLLRRWARNGAVFGAILCLFLLWTVIVYDMSYGLKLAPVRDQFLPAAAAILGLSAGFALLFFLLGLEARGVLRSEHERVHGWLEVKESILVNSMFLGAVLGHLIFFGVAGSEQAVDWAQTPAPDIRPGDRGTD